jgi:hypothetical protein
MRDKPSPLGSPYSTSPHHISRRPSQPLPFPSQRRRRHLPRSAALSLPLCNHTPATERSGRQTAASLFPLSCTLLFSLSIPSRAAEADGGKSRAGTRGDQFLRAGADSCVQEADSFLAGTIGGRHTRGWLSDADAQDFVAPGRLGVALRTP